MSQLNGDFLVELAKSCIVSTDILAVVKPHLQYSFIPTQEYKAVFKYIFDYYGTSKKAPTIGMMSQHFTDPKSVSLLNKIRETNVFDSKEQIVGTFEEFIKDARFMSLHQKSADLWNEGKRQDAIKILAEESKDIHAFSLKRKMHTRIFGQFDERQFKRQSRDFSLTKIPTGIPAFDYHTHGGFDRGTGLLGLARSGGGKTTFLRSLGMNAAFRGINVLHVAAGDSTREEVEDGYDAWWTGVKTLDIRKGDIGTIDSKRIDKAKTAWLAQCGEVFVHVFEQFHTATIKDVREVFIDLSKEYDIGLVLFDYLEKFDPGDGKKYSTNDEGGRARKSAIAEKIINMATEFKIGVATVTQANDIPFEKWNKPNFVLTRNNISNLKATIDPFAYFVTLNQTMDENDNEIMRIHEDKLRHYKIFSKEATYSIVQRREVGRFIDIGETKKRFWDETRNVVVHDVPRA